MFILGRNVLAGQADGPVDPWPCVPGTEGGVFIPNSLNAYQNFKAGLVKQNYKLDREIPKEKGDQQVFQFSKGAAVLIGMWAKAPAGNRSTLVFCQRAVNWKPAPTPGTPATAPTVRNNVLIGQNQNWPGGARELVITASMPDEESESGYKVALVARGNIAADGQFHITLPAVGKVPVGLLKPALEALLPERDSDSTCRPVNTLKVSPANAKLLIINELTVLKSSSKSTLSPDLFQSDFTLRNEGWTPQRGVDMTSLALVYATQAVNVTGQFKCASDVTAVNLSLPAGWSYVVSVMVINDKVEPATTTLTIQNAYDKYLDVWKRW